MRVDALEEIESCTSQASCMKPYLLLTPWVLSVHFGRIQVNFHISQKRKVPSPYVDNRKFSEQLYVYFETSRRRECCRCRDNYKQLQGAQNTPPDEKRPTECGGETPRCPTRISRNGRACACVCVVYVMFECAFVCRIVTKFKSTGRRTKDRRLARLSFALIRAEMDVGVDFTIMCAPLSIFERLTNGR